MKVLKIVLFIIAVLILLFIVLGFIGPKTFDVNRSLEMDAPQAMVYEQVSDLANMVEWDPWKEQIPDMETHVHGPSDQVGSYRRWESSESTGEELLVALNPPHSVESELKFIAPMESKAKGYSTVEDLGDGKSKLTIGFTGENDFMTRAMSMLPGMGKDAWVGPTFEKGLANVAGIVEPKAAEQKASRDKIKSSKYSIGVQERPAVSYVLKREVVAMDDISTFYGTNLPGIYTAVAASGAEMAGKPCGIYYTWNPEKGETDMCAAIPVSSKEVKIEGYETVTLPAGKTVVLPYKGDYSGFAEAHQAIEDYLKAYGLTQEGPVVEEYITDPSTEPDSDQWLTNIMYRVK